MGNRYNKMITVSLDDMNYIDSTFKRNFSQWISRQLHAHAAGLKYASELSTTQLLSMILARQDHTKWEEKHYTELVEMINDGRYL